MQTFVKGSLFNVYRSKDYQDKKTGEVNVGKWKLQFMVERDMNDGQGVQKVLQDISIPEELHHKYKDQIGKEVTVPVGVMSKNNNVIFFGVS